MGLEISKMLLLQFLSDLSRKSSGRLAQGQQLKIEKKSSIK